MITRSLAAALVMAALIAPPAEACRHDLRSQDALDAARSLPPDQLAAVAEALRSRADGSGMLDLVLPRL
jgi:hypothetical protein